MELYRNQYLTVALCASLALHALLLRYASDQYARSLLPIRLDPLPKAPAADDGPSIVVLRPAVPLPDEELFPNEKLGKQDGVGYATDDSPGDTALMARQAPQDQAFLSRDPEGPGKIGGPPSESLIPPGEGGEGGANGTLGAAAVLNAASEEQLISPNPGNTGSAAEPAAIDALPPRISRAEPAAEVAAPAFPGEQRQAEQRPDDKPAEAPQKERSEPTPDDAKPDASAQRPAEPGREEPTPDIPAATATAASALPGSPGAPTEAADPAPKGDSESDPFSTLGTIEFRPGATVAQLGRGHRITRPRLDLAGMVDTFPLGQVRLVLRIRIDASGNVAAVTIARSSGSVNIDQACRLAAYEWWFEPKPDRAGKPLASETIYFRISIL